MGCRGGFYSKVMGGGKMHGISSENEEGLAC